MRLSVGTFLGVVLHSNIQCLILRLQQVVSFISYSKNVKSYLMNNERNMKNNMEIILKSWRPRKKNSRRSTQRNSQNHKRKWVFHVCFTQKHAIYKQLSKGVLRFWKTCKILSVAESSLTTFNQGIFYFFTRLF